MNIQGIDLEVRQADITTLEVDAIVNAANNKLLMGGGVAGVIKQKGGVSIEEEAVAKGPIDIGASVETQAGNLPAKYVIHSATMGMDFKTDEHKIRAACKSALECANKLNCTSIAIPALGCGVGGFPHVGASRIMTQEAMSVIREKNTSLKHIIFCLYEKKACDVFEKNVYGYVKHFQEDMCWGPYVTVDIIIELPEGLVLIERSNPPLGWALPGGFVDRGESCEHAAIREAKEETNLDLEDVKQFHTYSDPDRDPRFQTVSTVFIAKGKGTPQFGDDAKGVAVIPYEEVLKRDYAFDHKHILEDYFASKL